MGKLQIGWEASNRLRKPPVRLGELEVGWANFQIGWVGEANARRGLAHSGEAPARGWGVLNPQEEFVEVAARWLARHEKRRAPCEARL